MLIRCSFTQNLLELISSSYWLCYNNNNWSFTTTHPHLVLHNLPYSCHFCGHSGDTFTWITTLYNNAMILLFCLYFIKQHSFKSIMLSDIVYIGYKSLMHARVITQFAWMKWNPSKLIVKKDTRGAGASLGCQSQAWWTALNEAHRTGSTFLQGAAPPPSAPSPGFHRSILREEASAV